MHAWCTHTRYNYNRLENPFYTYTSTILQSKEEIRMKLNTPYKQKEIKQIIAHRIQYMLFLFLQMMYQNVN